MAGEQNAPHSSLENLLTFSPLNPRKGRPSASDLLAREGRENSTNLYNYFQPTSEQTAQKTEQNKRSASDSDDELQNKRSKASDSPSGDGEKDTDDWRAYIDGAVLRILNVLQDNQEANKENQGHVKETLDHLNGQLTDVNKQLAAQGNLPTDPSVEARLARLEASAAGATQTPNGTLDKLDLCCDWLSREYRLKNRNNLVIKGLTLTGNDFLETVEGFITHFFELEKVVSSARRISKPGNRPILLVQLNTWEAKKKIMMDKKKKLADSRISIEDDIPPVERKKRANLRNAVRLAKQAGKQTKIAGPKCQIDSIWYTWDERTAALKQCSNPAPPSSPKN